MQLFLLSRKRYSQDFFFAICSSFYLSEEEDLMRSVHITTFDPGSMKNYETYNNERKEQVFASNSKFQIESHR